MGIFAMLIVAALGLGVVWPFRRRTGHGRAVAGLVLGIGLMGCGPSVESGSSPAPMTPVVVPGARLEAGEWGRFSIPEMGISFEFRPGKGVAGYDFDDQPDDESPCADAGLPGAIASWDIDFGPDSNKSGHRFAWVVSEGFGPDSGETVFAIERWIEAEGGSPRIVVCGKPDRFQTFGTYELEGGARGLVYHPGELGEPPFDPEERAAIVNFPPGYSARFHALNFSFWPPGGATMADIERVLRSVRFEGVPRN